MLRQVISGGQTGADQAGLIAAFNFGLDTGGTCPMNWETSTGPNYLLLCFGLTAKGTLRTRTIDNIRNSDGTVLATLTPQSPGSILTRNQAREQNKPILEVDLNPLLTARAAGDTVGAAGNALQEASKAVYEFVLKHRIAVLNVAGNRERTPEMTTTIGVCDVLRAAFMLLDQDDYILRDSDI